MVRTARFRSDQNASAPCHNTDEVQCPDRIQFSDSSVQSLYSPKAQSCYAGLAMDHDSCRLIFCTFHNIPTVDSIRSEFEPYHYSPS